MKATPHTPARIGCLGCGLAIAALLCLSFIDASGAKAAEPCPNEAIREAQVSATFPNGTTSLPDCMALEMVTPPKKYNQYTTAPNFSANGERIRYFALAALADTPSLGFIYDQYTATRTGSGWVTQALAAPTNIDVGSSVSGYPCAYSSDLSRWVLWGSSFVQAAAGITTPFQDSLDGPFEPIGPTLVPLSGLLNGYPIVSGACEGVSLDLTHFFFAMPAGISYLPGDPALHSPEPPGAAVYDAYLDEGVPTVALLQRDKDGVVHGGGCGARIGAAASDRGDKRGAVSLGAERVFFTARPGQTDVSSCSSSEKARIMVREQTPAGPVIEELISNECTRVSPPCASVSGDDTYLGASQDSERVYFSTPRQLVDSDKDTAMDLYLYDDSRPVGDRVTQVSAGDNTAPTPGEDAEYLGLPDFSGDGSRAYFVAKGVLTTTANGDGDTAQAGEPNLYLYQRDADFPSGRTVFIATLAGGDTDVWTDSPGSADTGGSEIQAVAVPLLGPDPEEVTVGGNGRWLLFASRAALDPTDTDGGKADVYRYDSGSGEMVRVSAAEPGGADNGSFNVEVTQRYLYAIAGPHDASFSRWVSEDGASIIFMTTEALDPEDQDSAKSVYLWREGELTPLPISPAGVGVTPTISVSGEQVAFVVADPLLPEDGDGAKDVYVARANGGYPIPVPPPPCVGEECQGPPGPRPGAQNAPSKATTAGNVKQPAACRKGQVRRRGRCVKRAKRKSSSKSAKRKSTQRAGGRK